MANINLSVIKYGFELFTKFSKDKDTKKQMLEPFSSVIKLGIISFSEPGTKIAIYDNKLFIQPPNLLQAPMRYAYGNNREEIHHLLRPLMVATELYSPNKNDELKYIYNLAVKGLKSLKLSYNNDSSTVCYTIDLYISIIQRRLEDSKIYIDSYDSFKDDPQSLDVLNQHVKLFKDLWDDSDISLIYNLFKSTAKTKDPVISSNYVNSIESLIKAKENTIEDKIKKTQII